MGDHSTDIEFLKNYVPVYGSRHTPEEMIHRFKVIARGAKRRLRSKQIAKEYSEELGLSSATVSNHLCELRAAAKAGHKTIEQYVRAGRPCHVAKKVIEAKALPHKKKK